MKKLTYKYSDKLFFQINIIRSINILSISLIIKLFIVILVYSVLYNKHKHFKKLFIILYIVLEEKLNELIFSFNKQSPNNKMLSCFKSLLFLFLLNKVSCIQFASQIGSSISVTALVLIVPHTYFFKTHFRALQFLQLTYLYQSIHSNSTYFSNNLEYTWLSFMPTFYNSPLCNTNQFLCNDGSILSVSTVLIGFLLLLSIIVLIISSKKQNIRLIPIFSLFKGLIRWIYIVLCNQTIYYVVQYFGSKMVGLIPNLIGPVVVLAICLLFPISQLVFTKCFQKANVQNPNDKWVQFNEYIRIIIISTLMQIYKSMNNYAYIGVYFVIVIYSIGYFFLYKFSNIIQRIVFLLTQSVNITLFSLFIFAPTYTLVNDIDFFLVIVVFSIEIINEIIKYIFFVRNDIDRGQKKVFNEISNFQNSVHQIESVQQVDKILQIASTTGRFQSKRYQQTRNQEKLTQIGSISISKKDNQPPITTIKKKR